MTPEALSAAFEGKKIAVVGSGAVGSYYGALLARAHDVSFLMRRDLEAVRRDGLTISSVNGDFHLPEVKAFASTAEMGAVDLVIIALKTTANEALPTILPPLLHENTVLLTLQNGFGNEQYLQDCFPSHSILGGMCFVCINRGEPGVIHHLAHGLIEMGALQPEAPLEAVVGLFQQAGIECRALENLGLARWRKLVWNVPFNGLTLIGDGIDTSHVVASPVLLERTRKLMEEVMQAAAAHGHSIEPEFAALNIQRTTDMGPYQPSSLLDYLAGNPVEVEAIWGLPLRLGEAKGVALPEWRALYEEILLRCATSR